MTVVVLDAIAAAAIDLAREAAETDAPEGTVLEVIQKGFLLGDRVLRPARVVVAGGES